jgi:hypothetical protein
VATSGENERVTLSLRRTRYRVAMLAATTTSMRTLT